MVDSSAGHWFSPVKMRKKIKIFFFVKIFSHFYGGLSTLSTPAFSSPPKRAEATPNFSILAHSNSLYKWFWTHFGIFLKKFQKKMKNSKKKSKNCASHNFSFLTHSNSLFEWFWTHFGICLKKISKKIEKFPKNESEKIENLCFAQFFVFGILKQLIRVILNTFWNFFEKKFQKNEKFSIIES